MSEEWVTIARLKRYLRVWNILVYHINPGWETWYSNADAWGWKTTLPLGLDQIFVRPRRRLASQCRDAAPCPTVSAPDSLRPLGYNAWQDSHKSIEANSVCLYPEIKPPRKREFRVWVYFGIARCKFPSIFYIRSLSHRRHLIHTKLIFPPAVARGIRHL